jgi:hypothetical protein
MVNEVQERRLTRALAIHGRGAIFGLNVAWPPSGAPIDEPKPKVRQLCSLHRIERLERNSAELTRRALSRTRGDSMHHLPRQRVS